MANLTKAQKSRIRNRYKGTWQSLLQLSYSFKVSPNVISFLVNHKGHRVKALAFGKQWRINHPGAMARYHKVYYKKHRKKLLENGRARYWRLKPKMKKIWAKKARQRYQDKLRSATSY